MDFRFLITIKRKVYLTIFKTVNSLCQMSIDKKARERKIVEQIRKELQDSQKKILVINTLSIGDLLVSTPVISTFKATFPKSEIDVLIRKPADPVVINNPHINEIFHYDEKNLTETIMDLRKRKYFLIIDLENSFLGMKRALTALRIESRYRIGFRNRFFEGLCNHLDMAWEMNTVSEVINYHNILKSLIPGIKAPEKLDIFFSEKDKKAIERIIKAQGIKKNHRIIIIHPTSQNKTREWSKERFAELINELKKDKDNIIILTGSNAENEKEYSLQIEKRVKDNSRMINLVGRISITEWFALIKRADLLISVDTSAVHIASATDTPTLALLGPTNQSVWEPYNKKNQRIISAGNCLSCEKDFKPPWCKYGDYRCMRAIETRQVIGNANKILRIKTKKG